MSSSTQYVLNSVMLFTILPSKRIHHFLLPKKPPLRIGFFRGLKISGKIFSRRYELSRDSRESILGLVVCKFILLVFSGGDSRLFFISFFIFQLRNRKHFPCFCRVIETRVEVWENEKCCGNTSRRRVFPQLFRVLPNLHECFYNSIETRRKRFLFLLENSPRKITKNEENLIVLFIIKT